MAVTAPEPTAPTSSDLDLLRDARAGDYDAFTALVDRYRPRVYGLARRVVRQPADAEDVTQQTFLSLVEHLAAFRGESSVAAWVFRIATNHALKLLRRRRTRSEVALGDDSEPLPRPEYIARWADTPDRLAQKAETAELLDRALGELDEEYRVVFVLRDVEGLSVRETAEALGLSEANVKVRLLRARLMLRERLTRRLGDQTTWLAPHDRHATDASAGGRP